MNIAISGGLTLFLYIDWTIMLREYEGDGNTGVGAGGGVVVVRAVQEYMGGTRGSDSVSSADDVFN